MIEYDVINVPIVDIVNQIIIYAADNRASDIHMDPRENDLIIRMRIDGELKNHTIIPKMYERNLITRVKLISNMNITETRLPQDGAIKGINGRDIDMRVSVLPTNEGEKVVIRILDYSKSLNGIDSLGFSEKNFKLLKNMINVPNGIILVTGATGSGKSTTTYSILQELNKENVNIITVEDPIEMNIEGINQVQVNSEIGLTFANVLRSILRQDPNIILIGEIRDSETAQIAVRASITGHLVLSTLHTNNSLSTIERLLDMDVERYLLSSALTGIISQKLARKLCDECKELRDTTPYEKQLFKKVMKKDIDKVYDAKGCDKCTQGYRGRIAIEEVLYIDDELRGVISNPSTSKKELSEMVYNENVTTLLADGLDKVQNGITTFNEIFKLIEIESEIKDITEGAVINNNIDNAEFSAAGDNINNIEKIEIKVDPDKLGNMLNKQMPDDISNIAPSTITENINVKNDTAVIKENNLYSNIIKNTPQPNIIRNINIENGKAIVSETNINPTINEKEIDTPFESNDPKFTPVLTDKIKYEDDFKTILDPIIIGKEFDAIKEINNLEEKITKSISTKKKNVKASLKSKKKKKDWKTIDKKSSNVTLIPIFKISKNSKEKMKPLENNSNDFKHIVNDVITNKKDDLTINEEDFPTDNVIYNLLESLNKS